jgi:hypothetical protein
MPEIGRPPCLGANIALGPAHGNNRAPRYLSGWPEVDFAGNQVSDGGETAHRAVATGLDLRGLHEKHSAQRCLSVPLLRRRRMVRVAPGA